MSTSYERRTKNKKLRRQSRRLHWRLAQCGLLSAERVEPPVASGLRDDEQHQRGEHHSHSRIKAIIEDQALGSEHLAGGYVSCGQLFHQLTRLGQETDVWVRAPDLLGAGGHSYRDEPTQRQERDPGEATLTHLDHDSRAHAKRDSGQKLVRNSEQRPHAVDAA